MLCPVGGWYQVFEIALSTVQSISVFVVAVYSGRCFGYYSVQVDDFFVSAFMDLAARVETRARSRGSPAMAVYLIEAVAVNYRKETV